MFLVIAVAPLFRVRFARQTAILTGDHLGAPSPAAGRIQRASGRALELTPSRFAA